MTEKLGWETGIESCPERKYNDMQGGGYDYRYSRLTHVFGRLLYEGRVSEEELRGLGEDKLKSIRSLADLLAKYGD